MIIEINDIDSVSLSPYRSLTETQLRNRLDPANGIFIAESPTVIAIALDAGCQPLSLLTARRHLLSTAKPLVERLPDIPIYTADDSLLAALTGYHLTRGVLCAMRRPAPMTASQVCSGKHRIAVIDSVVNATNTGAIFRAAAALGIDAVLLSGSSCDPLNRRCVRVSMGTVFQLPWAFLDRSLDDGGLLQLRQLGFSSVAMALSSNAIPINHPQIKALDRLAIILGNEGDGLPTSVIGHCDLVAQIPMQNHVDSLNVAAAAAVAFWEVSRPLDPSC